MGFFDKHSGFLGILISGLLLLYTAGLFLVWLGLALEDYGAVTFGAYLVIFPTELAILASYSPKARGFAFRRIQLKTHSAWLLLDRIYRFVTGLDLMFAAIGGAIPGLYLTIPAVRPGYFTADKIALLWAAMALLALFAVLYGRGLMQLLGLRYETIGGHSLAGAAACASVASFELGKDRKAGLDYLESSLSHIKSVFSARRSTLVSIDDTRLAVKSLQDSALPPFAELRKLADGLAALPNLTELPTHLHAFLSSVKWPTEIRPAVRRTYGIESVAATATVTAAVVGLLASIIQVEGSGVVTNSLLSPVAAYVIGIGVTFVVVAFLYRTLSQFSVESTDVDEYEKDLMLRAGVAQRTTLDTMYLVPKALFATGMAAFAFISGFFLVGSLIIAIWYRSFLNYFPSSIFVFAVVLFVSSFLLTYALVRDVWRKVKPRKP